MAGEGYIDWEAWLLDNNKVVAAPAADGWTAFVTAKRAEWINSAFAKDDAMGVSLERFLGEAIAARVLGE